jgi:hypothetical protein
MALSYGCVTPANITRSAKASEVAVDDAQRQVAAAGRVILKDSLSDYRYEPPPMLLSVDRGSKSTAQC